MAKTSSGTPVIKGGTITIRAYCDQDLDAVLDLIRKSDSTVRTAETWCGNDMTAMLAFDGDRLIGIIPFEKRIVVLDDSTKMNVLWVSAAHVEPEYRGQGIGTRLDKGIKDIFLPEFEAIFVIRKDEGSAAYRWYKKLGYHHLTNILSLKRKVAPMEGRVTCVVFETAKEFEQYGSQLKNCFEHFMDHYGGYPQRDEKFWAHKFNYHYYKAFYNYKIVAVRVSDIIQAYALLGQTSFWDGIERFDILEFVTPPNEDIRMKLWNAILSLANQLRLGELRVQLADGDPAVEWFKNLGFIQRWQTNLLGKYINSEKEFSDINWKFFHIDYI